MKACAGEAVYGGIVKEGSEAASVPRHEVLTINNK